MSGLEIVLGRTDDLNCRRCGGELLLIVRVPTTTPLPAGDTVDSYRTVELCPRCDRDDQAAQGVLACFAVHERIEHDTVNDLAPALREWLAHLAANPPTYTEAELDEDIRQWQAGEM
ncbi:hypothetical protein CU254_42255 (plasmid) [Amycolatopsis sp. AA4]|uniref:DUF6300 family protein n=1 Tax=Actinomycetes TaxID=1760 RepID=UPI0001B566CF|nr:MULTISPECIES: DUF6300 family protein [Actinomycetes]ATY17195.1 hypothetical protein CU254_42255 [Amycolatopsis sp. AA4]EFL12565.1 predicted protein [Streptomyces sp. AA4]